MELFAIVGANGTPSKSGRRLVCLALALLCTSCATSPAALSMGRQAVDTASALPKGNGSFTFSGWSGVPLRVWYHIPNQITARTPVTVVMHGAGRNAQSYRDAWTPHAVKNDFILVVPEFSERDFPTAETYNSGHMVDAAGLPRPREQWTYSAIEPLFDEIKRRTGSRVPTYGIYGHSAGGQFVHRMVMLMPGARYHRAVAANAGWYTMPDLDQPFPYGLQGTKLDRRALAVALGKPLTVLLGTADIDPNHHQLRRTPEAMAQGPNRLERGRHFFAAGQATASRLRARFGWHLAYAEGIAHSNSGMAGAAAPLLQK